MYIIKPLISANIICTIYDLTVYIKCTAKVRHDDLRGEIHYST